MTQANNEMKEFNDSITELFKSKKEEITSASGGITALQELLSQHTKLMEQIRVELQTSLSNGQLAAEAANAALGFFGRSNRLIIEFLTNAKSRIDIKSGELMAYNLVIKQLEEKVAKAEEEVAPVIEEIPAQEKNAQPQEAPQPSVSEVEVEPTPAPEPVVKQVRNRKRPDEVKGKLGDTVKRIKNSRKKSSGV